MVSTTNTKFPPDTETPGIRLSNIIIKHFVNQAKFASYIQVDKGALSSYITGAKPFTDKFARKIEVKSGINSQYLLYGTEPIIKDKSLLLVQDDSKQNIRHISLSSQKQGITAQYIILDELGKTHIKDNGEANIVNLLLPAAKDISSMLYLFSNKFSNEYNMKHGTLFICVDKEVYEEGDMIVYEKLNKLVKLGFYKAGSIIELNTKIVENPVEIETFGVVLYKIEEFRYEDL